jgi:predicted Fe-S protein YdhL (DUF1289 family)
MSPRDEKRQCSACLRTYSVHEFQWTRDRYGIEYRKVCFGCFDKVQSEIWDWTFDAADAGERLDDDY